MVRNSSLLRKMNSLKLLSLCASILVGISFLSCNIVSKTPALKPTEVESQIKAVLELPTYEYVYRDIIYIAEQADFLGIRHKDKQLLFSIDVNLQAGIDLSKGVEVKPATTEGFAISLPPPEILLIDADENTIHQYFKKEFGGEIGRLEYYDEISSSKERIRQDAIERGVLIQARENAASVIRSLLQSQGLSVAKILFRPHPATTAPEPAPEPAQGTSTGTKQLKEDSRQEGLE